MKLKRTAIQQALDKHGTIAAQGPLSSFMAPPPNSVGDVGFSITPGDRGRVSEILARCNRHALAVGLPEVDSALASMDLFAAHTNDFPIDFKAMHECPDVVDVMQFIGVLGSRIDRSTGKIFGGWRGKFHIKVA